MRRGVIPPLGLSRPLNATGLIFARVPPELGDAGWHTAARRQVVIDLKGETEQQVSDGETRRVGAGDVIVAEDTAGKGHRSINLSGEQLVVFVPLND